MSMFVAAAEGGSLSAAGRRFGAPLPTVSRKISELETHLGARLFVRTTRKLALTDAGAAFLRASRRILEDMAEAERAAAGEYLAPRGDLILTAPVVFGRLHVLPVVCEFLAAYPEVNVRLALSDRTAHLVEDHIDAALRIGVLPDSGLVARRVGAVRWVVCGSPDYFARAGRPRTPHDLAGIDAVVFEGPAEPARWPFSGAPAVTVRPRLAVATAEAAVDAAAAGIGVTRVLDYQAAEAVRAGRLAYALEAFEPEPWAVSLVHAGQGLLPLKLRAFLDFAAPRLRARLEALTAARRNS